MRGGSAVARGTSSGARYPLKQSQSLPDIKADAGNRRNTMIFRKNIPWLDTKEKRMFRGDVLLE